MNKRLRIIIAIAAGIMAAIIAMGYLSSREAQLVEMAEPLQVLAVAGDIPRGEIITPADLVFAEVPARFVPPAAFATWFIASAAWFIASAAWFITTGLITTGLITTSFFSTGKLTTRFIATCFFTARFFALGKFRRVCDLGIVVIPQGFQAGI